MSQEQTPRRRSSAGSLLLTVLVLGASVVGMAVYQALQQSKSSQPPDAAGFDVADVDEAPASAVSTATPQPQSSLTAPSRMEGLHFGKQAAAKASPAATALSFKEAVWNNEKLVRNLAIAYTKKYPLIAQYGRDWMSYPDLKKLNDDYMRDRDPVKFMKGVAKSKNFGKLVKKYASAPPIQNFVQEAIGKAPPQTLSTSMEYVTRDGALKQLVYDVSASLGLPPGLLAGMLGGGKVDEKKIMGRIMEHAESPGF